MSETTRDAHRASHLVGPGSGSMGLMERTLDDWITEVSTELGIDLDVDVRGLLDLTRVVAHGVDRPAAPLTAFLVGYAAAQRGGGAAAVAEARVKAEALAERWIAQAQQAGPAGA